LVEGNRPEKARTAFPEVEWAEMLGVLSRLSSGREG
jgi:hypothetical protein